MPLHVEGNFDSAHRPTVQLAAQPRDVLAQTWDVVLAVNNPPWLFRRRGELVVYHSDAAAGAALLPVSADELTCLLVEHADWVNRDSPSRPPVYLVRMMMAKPHPDLPEVNQMQSVPGLAPGGHLLVENGYYAEERVFVQLPQGLHVTNVPEDPGEPDIDAARIRLLGDLLGDFPFAGPSDRAHCLAALLTPFVRPLLPNACTPLFLITAHCPGSGKTLLARTIATVIGEDTLGMTSLSSQDSENRKKLTALLRHGHRVICFDNLAHERVSSPSLAACLTSPMWTDRILGHSTPVILPNKTLILGTGNNPRLAGELSRRCVPIRLDPGQDTPWLRKGFQHPDLLKWVREQRGILVHACLTLVQAWVAQGRPGWIGNPLGSFERWSEVLGGVLQTAQVPGFLESLDVLYSDSDNEDEEWRALARLWFERFGAESVRVTDLVELCTTHDLLLDEMGGGTERSRKTRLGRALQRNFGRVFGPYRLDKNSAVTRNSTRWRLHLASRAQASSLPLTSGGTTADAAREVD